MGRKDRNVIVGLTDQRPTPGEVAVQQELVVEVDRLHATPCFWPYHAQEIRVHALAGEPSVDDQEPGVERPFDDFRPGRVVGSLLRRGHRGEGGGVPDQALQRHHVAAADQHLVRVEQFCDGRTEQRVGVAAQHLPIAAQAERFEEEERGQFGAKGRVGGAQAGQPSPEFERDRLEPHAVGRRGEHGAVCFGQSVVRDDDVAVESGVVFQKGAEHDERAGRE